MKFFDPSHTLLQSLLERIHVGLEAIVVQGLDDVLGLHGLSLLLFRDFARARIEAGKYTQWRCGGGRENRHGQPA